MAFLADEAFALLEAAHRDDRLSHAYLITGPAESGTRELAIKLTALLTGKKDDPLKHPDVHIAEPEMRSRRIGVDRMRAIEHELHLHSRTGGRKVAIIFDADRLNEQAANAFLKTLEEPPPGTHILLVTALPDQLLETILSRCIEVPLRASGRREMTSTEEQLLAMLVSFSKLPAPTLPNVFMLVRDFQSLLSSAKEQISDECDEACAAELKRYKQTTDMTGDWFDARKDYYKALAEARYRHIRSAMLETLELWWADILRQQSGATHLDLPTAASHTAALAERIPTTRALKGSTAIARLRELFNTNAQEALAIEVTFLDAFAA